VTSQAGCVPTSSGARDERAERIIPPRLLTRGGVLLRAAVGAGKSIGRSGAETVVTDRRAQCRGYKQELVGDSSSSARHLVTYTEGDADLARACMAPRAPPRCLTYRATVTRTIASRESGQHGSTSRCTPAERATTLEMLQQAERYRDENIRSMPAIVRRSGHGRRSGRGGESVRRESSSTDRIHAFGSTSGSWQYRYCPSIIAAQAMGNISPCWAGQKVYLRTDVTSGRCSKAGNSDLRRCPVRSAAHRPASRAQQRNRAPPVLRAHMAGQLREYSGRRPAPGGAADGLRQPGRSGLPGAPDRVSEYPLRGVADRLLLRPGDADPQGRRMSAGRVSVLLSHRGARRSVSPRSLNGT